MTAPDDWRPLYPFESHWITIEGLRYHYLDEGAGPVLLLVHGNPTWSFYWRELVKALRPRYRVVVPDHIGCGLSDKPDAGRYPYRLTQRIADLSRLIVELDLRQVTLIGHDWGGMIGLGAALALPERFARLVLMNTAAFRSDRCPRRLRFCQSFLGRIAIQGLNLFARLGLRVAVSRRDRITPAIRAGYLAPYGSWSQREAIYRFVRDIPLRPDHPSYPTLTSIESGLSQLRRHPICLIWGMDDWCFTPHFLDRFLEFLPEAEVHRLEGANHYVVEDAHEQIAPILERFFESHPLA
jgi:haloalkane dehalogenase